MIDDIIRAIDGARKDKVRLICSLGKTNIVIDLRQDWKTHLLRQHLKHLG